MLRSRRMAGSSSRAAVSARAFQRQKWAVRAEADLQGFEHHVADVGAADGGARGGAPGDDLAIMSVENEPAADDLAVPNRLKSKPSEHQRRLERIITTFPSWLRPGRWPLCFSSSRPWVFISR
jgi:hypothetical protein